jgi:hypothetical protein
MDRGMVVEKKASSSVRICSTQGLVILFTTLSTRQWTVVDLGASHRMSHCGQHGISES